MTKEAKHTLLPCPFCGGDCDPKGWMSLGGNQGPECNGCGATATSIDEWNAREGLDPSAIKDVVEAGDAVGEWLSAAMGDATVCAEMKSDINTFLQALSKVRGEGKG